MKAVSLLLNSYLPEDVRDYSGTYDVKDMNRILHEVALKHPDQYSDVVKKVSDLGRTASYIQGETITLKDLEPVIDKKNILAQMDAEIKALPKDRDFKQKRHEIFQKYTDRIEKETANNALRNRNNIAMSVLSGARGKMPQLRAMISPVGTFSDYKGEVIDVYSKESFAEGIRPATFLASTYGTRASTVSTKCLEQHTLVRMADLSIKEIKDIVPGDVVLGADTQGKVFPTKVVSVFDQGEQDCWEYHFRCSSTTHETASVTCTKEHKFLMVSGREYRRKRALYQRGNGPHPKPEDQHLLEVDKAERMRRGARSGLFNPVTPQGGYNGTVTEEWALLLGLLIGDGCMTVRSVTLLSCADLKLIEDIEDYVDSLGQRLRKIPGENYSWAVSTKSYTPLDNNSIVKGTAGFVKGARCVRNELLERYGLKGCYAWEKRLPIGWKTWTKESVANLLAGLLAADGSFYSSISGSGTRKQVSCCFAVTSEGLVDDVKLALQLYFGIYSRKELPVTKGGFASSTEERVHPLYSLEISRAEDVLLLHKEIGHLIPGIKRETFDTLVKQIIIKHRNPYAKWMFWDKTHIGNKHCYDIEVEHADHLFVLANHIITSNSSTAKGGDLAKQFASIAADMVIRKDDCGTNAGIAMAPDDASLKGRVLAKAVGKYPAGTVITRGMMDEFRKTGTKYVIARSPLTCGCTTGLCSKCVGKMYKGGKFPRVGDAVGTTASSTSMEPVTQMALCLAAGTKVRLHNGKDKAIEKVKVGDVVQAVSLEGDILEGEVVDTFNQREQQVRKYTLQGIDHPEDTLIVSCTGKHKFMSYDEAALLDINSRTIDVCQIRKLPIAYFKGNELRWAKVTKASEPKLVQCYDIEIDTLDHLFQLANGLVTSNSAKHTAGMTKGKKSFSGLEAIQQFTQSPEKFKDIGVVSEVDGRVESVEKAPQGGLFITVAGQKHYIPAGHEEMVHPGDVVEAGDQLADGLVDAEDVVRLKGLGEGRKYYAERLNKILEDSGAKTDKRNTEILARAAIRHVRIDNNEGIGNYLPDDIVDYNALQASYVPTDAKKLPVSDSVGRYLAKPVLHYTVGTRITPYVASYLKDHEVADVEAMDNEPEFKPEMVRLRTSTHYNPDWLASMSTSYLTQQLNESATRGDDTNIESNPDYRPRLMYGKDFGKKVEDEGDF